MPGVHQKVTYTETNVHLKAPGLFKYVRPFSGHQNIIRNTCSYLFNSKSCLYVISTETGSKGGEMS